MNLNILYIFPFDFYGLANNSFLTVFNRISNYLHSKSPIKKYKISEQYLDLRYENLPEYNPKNITIYRRELEKKLSDLYSIFPYKIIAISCYSSFSYLNSVEVASMIKSKINSKCIIIVGGPHATIRPIDFEFKSIPKYIGQFYELKSTPFDFLIKEEGEIPFYKFIRNYIHKYPRRDKTYSNKLHILGPELLEDLEDLPLIDLGLFKNYKDVLNRPDSNLNIDFSRGCPFKCKYCPNSAAYINCYKIVRVKTVKKCIEELQKIRDFCNVKHVFINDMILIPKKSKKQEFFEEITHMNKEDGDFPFKIEVEERIDLCSQYDLSKYKKAQIIPQFGLESASRTLLARIGKVLGKNNAIINKGVKNYLQKAEELIIEAHRIEFPINFFYVIGLPGTDQQTIRESQNFFLEKRYNGNSLIEKYKVNLRFAIYHNYFGTYLYDNAKDLYGTKMLIKDWWKLFTKDQIYYSQLVQPSKDLSFLTLLEKYMIFLKQVFQKQIKLNNSFYSIYKYKFFKDWMGKLRSIYNKEVEKNS